MMKAGILVLLCLYCCVECRKAYVPLDKNANLAFINMEAGGGARPPSSQPPAGPSQPPAAPSSPAKPLPPPNVKPNPVSPTQPPVKPVVAVVAPTPVPAPKPTPQPSPVKPAGPTSVTTPGPGTVKQLVNFYDSQGKASPIRPYSYSQAVKQG